MKALIVLSLLITTAFASNGGVCDIFVCDLRVKKDAVKWYENNLEIREPCQSCISNSEVHQGDFVLRIEVPSASMLKMNLKYRGQNLFSLGVPRGTSDIEFESSVGTIRCHNKSLDLKANQGRLEMAVENMLAEPDAYEKDQFIEVREEVLSHLSEGGRFNHLLLSLFLKQVKDLRIFDVNFPVK